MKKLNLLSLIIILFFFFVAPNNLLANYKGEEKDKGKKPTLQKTLLNPRQSLMNINNATMWVTNEGFHDWVVASSWNGAFPNGTSVGAIFAEGVVWGGKVNDGKEPLVRVDGNTYGTGCSPVTRLYRVRPDYLTADLTSDAATFNDIPLGQVTDADIQTIRDQYALDWQEWPARTDAPEGNHGAPYTDVDDDGVYDPNIDIPGIPGASQTLFIKYNDDISESNYGSPPIGLEVSETYWAYSYSGALGNVIYKKMDMVYKGLPDGSANSTIDSMYIVQWADPDVGTSSDDFAGCDTTLNLGYAYNSTPSDGTYAGLGLAPPAVGYDFFSGVSSYTGNPDDSAVVDLKWKKGYKYINPKPMSSFIYFAAGGAWEDPDFNYNGTLEFYNLMRGKLPIPRYPSANPFPTEVADVTPYGTYLYAGDPVTETGKIDGTYEGPGDRRIMVVNGPITLSKGDTAQIVLGLVYGLGTDNKTSITALKTNDNTAQIVFDQLFQLPSVPPPSVKVAALSNEVVLNWGFDESSISNVENYSDQNYTFQGYEVYQVPTASSSLSDGVLLGTWDIVDGITSIYDEVPDANGTLIPTLVANGTDKGLNRNLTITQDQVRKQALRNGQEYYFAVVAYAYNPSPLLPFHVARSPFIIQRVVPQAPNPGVTYSSAPGDVVDVTHTGGSDGIVDVTVVDPNLLTGHDYQVNFAADGTWSLTDETTDEVKLTDQTNQSGDEDYYVIDGLLIKVIGPPVAINTVSYGGGTRWVTGVNWGGAQFFGGLDLGANFFGSDVEASGYLPIRIEFTADPTISEATGWSQGAAMLQSAGYAIQGKGWMPFKVFDISDPSNPRQLNVSFRMNNATPTKLQWDMSWDGSGYTDTDYFGRNYTFFQNTPYDPDYYINHPELDPTYNDVMYALWPAQRSTYPYQLAAFTMTIVPNYANTTADVFTFKAPAAPTTSAELAKKDVEKINVFPNPYYGFQYRETAPNNKYVTFSHLPDNAVIRIFDISGVLVKTINHVPAQGQFETWNLANDNNYPVASGIYVAYIDMPDLGTTKVLKLAVIQEQQMLKVY